MRHLPRFALVSAALLLAVLAARLPQGSGDSATAPTPASAPFDFYVLARSWSPAFCATDAGRDSPLQCGPSADHGFVTHGLWPQFEDGWPSFCASPHGDRVPDAVARSLLPIMPDRGLIAHQWDKHGTCTGLSPQDWAEVTRQATARITIPPAFAATPPRRIDARALERAFAEANPGFDERASAVRCPSGRLTEVRLCLTPGLAPRACPQVDADGCRQAGLAVAAR